MRFEIRQQNNLRESLGNIFFEEYKWSENVISESLDRIEDFLETTVPDLNVGIEYPYVDKLYRDSYYNYYSSKLNAYHRNCIRLSFFSTAIVIKDFYHKEGAEKLQQHFLGFLVIRPTSRSIGRNVFRPDLFKKSRTVFTTFMTAYASINGVKLTVEGFPHCSQDAEMMVCAETTIWSIIEYFSHKYPEYKTILPHDINKILSATSMERQIPSGGLTGLQMSFTLKELGFGVKMYSSQSYQKENLLKIIQIYIESGIPVVTPIGNKNLGHVMNIVGRTDFDETTSFTFSPNKEMAHGSVLYDYYEQPSTYVVVDDNLRPYSEIKLDDPASNYVNSTWEECVIDAAIVPLHYRIYMEADKASEIAYEWLIALSNIIYLPSLVVRTLLTSSRSLKHYVALNSDFTDEVKTILLSVDMPKFVWLTELSTIDLVSKKEACGILLIDATEPKRINILGTFIENTYVKRINGKIKRYKIDLPPFKIFHNLKPY